MPGFTWRKRSPRSWPAIQTCELETLGSAPVCSQGDCERGGRPLCACDAGGGQPHAHRPTVPQQPAPEGGDVHTHLDPSPGASFVVCATERAAAARAARSECVCPARTEFGELDRDPAAAATERRNGTAQRDHD